MADQKSLRIIGFGFGAVTAAVMMVATMVLVNLDRNVIEQVAPVALAAPAVE